MLRSPSKKYQFSRPYHTDTAVVTIIGMPDELSRQTSISSAGSDSWESYHPHPHIPTHNSRTSITGTMQQTSRSVIYSTSHPTRSPLHSSSSTPIQPKRPPLSSTNSSRKHAYPSLSVPIKITLPIPPGTHPQRSATHPPSPTTPHSVPTAEKHSFASRQPLASRAHSPSQTNRTAKCARRRLALDPILQRVYYTQGPHSNANGAALHNIYPVH